MEMPSNIAVTQFNKKLLQQTGEIMLDSRAETRFHDINMEGTLGQLHSLSRKTTTSW